MGVYNGSYKIGLYNENRIPSKFSSVPIFIFRLRRQRFILTLSTEIWFNVAISLFFSPIFM